MKKLFSLRFITHLVICSASIPMLAACAESRDVSEEVGTIRLPLSAASASGARYRLVNGSFDLTGPLTTTLYGDTESSPTLVRESVPVGAYSLAIRSGWQVQREFTNGSLMAVDATLVSPVSQSFTIYDGVTTGVAYLFNVGDELVEFGSGQLNVTFLVEANECAAPAVDCAGSCVDTSSDNANCGACGVTCPTATTCTLGSCVPTSPTCSGGLVSCGNVCVDISSDEANCGGCGLVCPSATTCGSGSCVPDGGTQAFVVPMGDMPIVPTPLGPAAWVEFTAVDDCPGCMDGVGIFSPSFPGPGMCMAGTTTSGDVADLSIIGLVSAVQTPILPPTFAGFDLSIAGSAPDVRLVVSDGGSPSRTAEVDLGSLAGNLDRFVSAGDFRCTVGMPPENCLADLSQATAVFLLVPGGLATSPFDLCATRLAFRF